MWIELHQAVPNHRKTLHVADELGMAPIHVTGHLVGLWLWALDNAPDGVLRASVRTIARAAQWEGDPQAFIQALVRAEYLDETENAYAIHDWADYTGRLLELKERTRQTNRQRQRRWREAHNAGVTRDAEPTVTSNNGLTGPNLTGPNRTRPNQDPGREPGVGGERARGETTPTQEPAPEPETQTTRGPIPKPSCPGADLADAFRQGLGHDGAGLSRSVRREVGEQLKELVGLYTADQVRRCTAYVVSEDWVRERLDTVQLARKVVKTFPMWVQNGEPVAWKPPSPTVRGRDSPAVQRPRNDAFADISQRS